MLSPTHTEEDIVNQPGFVEFLSSDFDATTHAHSLLGKSVSLVINLEQVKKQINSQVSQSHDHLLDSVKDLHYMESVTKEICEHQQYLQDAYKTLKQKISEPFKEMKHLTNSIQDLSRTSDQLRSISRFLKLYDRLELLFDDDDEYPRTAAHLYDIEQILNNQQIDTDFIQDQIKTVTQFGIKLRQYGTTQITQGIQDNKALQLSKGFQIFVNLRQVTPTIISIMSTLQTQLQIRTQEAFDVVTINQTLTASQVTDQKQSKPISTKANISHWANILWQRIEVLTDMIYSTSRKIMNLQTYLLREKNNFTQESLIDPVVIQLDTKSLKNHFWLILSQNLDLEIKKATKTSQFLLQVLQAGYPKLLRVFVDLFSKLALTSTDDKSVEMGLIMKTLSVFESAYVSRVLSRMLDTVGSLVPEKSSRTNPGTEEAIKLIRSLASELNAVKFDDHLLKSVGKNVTQALTLFQARLVSFMNLDQRFQITATLGTNQILKIDGINCLSMTSDLIWDLLQDYDGSVIEEVLVQGSKQSQTQMCLVVEKCFLDILKELEWCVWKMHREDYSGKKQLTRPVTNSANSTFVVELFAKIRWVFREFISKVQSKNIHDWCVLFIRRMIEIYLLNVSMLIMNAAGKTKVLEDLGQLEYVLKQSSSLFVRQDVEMYDDLREFKKMIGLDLGDIIKSELKPVYVINHVLMRQDDISSPMMYYGWTEVEYCEWLDQHDDKMQRELLKNILDLYLVKVEAEGKKETCLEHPVLRSVLLKWQNE